MTPETKWAYVAGIFDGEGCVDIYNATQAKASKSPSFMLRASIAQKDGKIMNWLVEQFGGNVQMSRKQEKYYIYRWDIRSQAAKKFLEGILPYSIIKRKQIEFAIEFEERKGKYLYTQKGSKGFNKLSDSEIEWRYAAKERIKGMKREYTLYTKNGAPTTTKREEAQ